jgi:hypothetical protein
MIGPIDRIAVNAAQDMVIKNPAGFSIVVSISGQNVQAIRENTKTVQTDQVDIGEKAKKMFAEQATKVQPTTAPQSTVNDWSNRISPYSPGYAAEAYRKEIENQAEAKNYLL